MRPADKRVSQLNAELARIAVTAAVDLSLVCADQRFHLSSASGHLVLRTETASTSDASIELTSRDAARKALAGGGGRAAMMASITSGDLKLRGNAIEQFTSLHEELDLGSSTTARLLALAQSLLFEESAPWVPDAASSECMRCSAPFSFRRRRHHCRRCGKLFCSRCAPAPTTQQAERVCIQCAAAPAVSAAQPMAATAPPGPSPVPAEAWLLENYIERELRTISRYTWAIGWLLACLAGAAVGALWPSNPREYAVMGVCALVLLLLRSWLWRYTRVASVCLVIGLNVMTTKYSVRGRPEGACTAIWEIAHRVNARYIFDAVSGLGGFWVKLAQGASVFSAMPEAFNVELSRLQDAMPPDPIEEVHAILRAELGPRWNEVVLSIEPAPLGCATIAQVHRAKICVPAADLADGHAASSAAASSAGGGGTSTGHGSVGSYGESMTTVDAVIKVQHPLVSERLEIDIYASQLLAALLGYLAPMLFRDLSTVVKDLAKITRGELDFRQEASNQRMAREAIGATGLDVRVPRVYNSLVSRRLLAMEYVAGTKLTEMRSVAGVDESDIHQVVESLVRFYGATMHGPIFHCDPHPGNLLVEPSGTLVVLDWGQAQRLSMPERRAYAQLFAAIMMEDFNLLSEACATLGVPFKDFETAPDSTPATMVGAMRFVLRQPKASRQLAKADFRVLEETLGGLSDEVKSIQGGGTDLFKGALMPFSKTAALLFEVSTILGCALPILPMLTAEGYRVLLDTRGFAHVPLHQKPEIFASFILGLPPYKHQAAVDDQPGSPMRSPSLTMRSPMRSPGRSPASPRSDAQQLHGAFLDLLTTLHAEGLLLGAQLSVVSAANGAPLVDASIGHCTWSEPHLVTPDTVFNMAEVSKLFIAVSVLRLVERGRIALTAKVNGEASGEVTLEHILAHTAGHVEIISSAVTSFVDMCSVETMAALVAKTAPIVAPNARQQYHHSSFGWLLAHACKLAGTTVDAAWAELVDVALGRDSSGRLSLHAPGSDRLNGDGEQQLAGVAMCSKTMSVATMDNLIHEFGYFTSVIGRGASKDATEAERVDGKVWLSLFGKPQWIEPPAMARPRARRATLPGLAAYATARDVTAALHAVASGNVLAPHTLENALRSRKPPPSEMSKPSRMPLPFRSFQDAEWGLGIQLVEVGASRAGGRTTCWGHLGTNSSFALVIPGRRPLVATLLLNRSGGQAASQRVLDMLLHVATGGNTTPRS